MRLPLIAALALVLAAAAPAPAPSPFEPEIAAMEAADKAHPPEKGAVMFLGSSSIRLWTTLAEDFKGVPVVNRGFGGSQVADSTRFAERIVIPYRPSRIVFYAGDNDIASGRTPAQVLSDFKALVKKLRKALPGIRIAFVAIKPCPARWSFLAQVQEANALVAAYAKTAKGLEYFDVFTPMLGADGQPLPGLYAADGLHLSPEGYRLWTRVIAPRLK
ncbi:MAG: SGNH/GDSL hydrolase family protein [Elusimicrobiota bacterium]|jgi:lysophospholipase L1-like esterase